MNTTHAFSRIHIFSKKRSRGFLELINKNKCDEQRIRRNNNKISKKHNARLLSSGITKRNNKSRQLNINEVFNLFFCFSEIWPERKQHRILLTVNMTNIFTHTIHKLHQPYSAHIFLSFYSVIARALSLSQPCLHCVLYSSKTSSFNHAQCQFNERLTESQIRAAKLWPNDLIKHYYF